MLITDTPRTLVYKDIEDINYFLGDNSEITMEREFYNRMYKRPFIMRTDNPLHCALSVFNNARYIYYLIKCEEEKPSHYLSLYLEKAAESIEDIELKSHITAFTMALVYSWLDSNLRNNKLHVPGLNKEIFVCFDENNEKDIIKLNEDIYIHFSEERATITAENISDFHYLHLKNSNLPTKIDTLFDDIRDIEDAASNAPCRDVAMGIDYLLECYDPQNDTNAEHFYFLYKILKRFENEKSLTCDSETIEKAIATIKQRLQSLETTQEPEPSHGLSIDDIDVIAVEEDLIIPPDIKEHMEWIHDINKAPKILRTLKHYMEGKTKPKRLLMAFCAAHKADLIDKPTRTDYEKVFPDHPISSDSLLRRWIYDGESDYRNSSASNLFNEMYDEFTKIKNSAL